MEINVRVAAKLDELAALLDAQRANPFRVRAYRQAAHRLRQLDRPVTTILDTEGVEGLEQLPDIGHRLARTIRDIVRLGHFPMLDRVLGDSAPEQRLMTVPGIGRILASRLHEALGLETLEDLEAAVYDGRLAGVAGLGPKRVEVIRAVLAQRLARIRPRSQAPGQEPTVEELLDIDREYREASRDGRLPMIAPRRFNPEHRAWLPILHTHRGDRHYTALYSNTARAHRLGKTHDWVIIYRDDDGQSGQWTVVPGRHGERVVRGREVESNSEPS